MTVRDNWDNCRYSARCQSNRFTLTDQDAGRQVFTLAYKKSHLESQVALLFLVNPFD